MDSTILEKVFEWCDENKDFFVRQSADFFLKRRFDNRNEALQLTAWQRDFFKRNRADLWRLARAANDLDLPKFYNACCFQLAEEMRRHSAEEVAAMFEGSASLAKEAIPMPDDIHDDIIGDVLRFTDHVDLDKWKRIGARWKRVIDDNQRFLPLATVTAEVKGENVKILGCSVDEGPNTEECFHNLEPLNRYAVVQLNICDFGDRESAVVEEFLAGSTGRLRVKLLDVRGLPQESRIEFRSRMKALVELCEKLAFLEHVRLYLSCEMHVNSLVEEPSLLAFPARFKKLSLSVDGTGDSDAFRRLVAVASSSWKRTLSMEKADLLSDAIPLMLTLCEKFSRVANLIPLEISAFTRSRGSANVEEAAENLREFLATPGFKQVSSGNSHDGGMSFEYRKEHQMCFKYETRSREDGWKMSVEYINGGLNIAVKKAAE